MLHTVWESDLDCGHFFKKRERAASGFRRLMVSAACFDLCMSSCGRPQPDRGTIASLQGTTHSVFQHDRKRFVVLVSSRTHRTRVLTRRTHAMQNQSQHSHIGSHEFTWMKFFLTMCAVYLTAVILHLILLTSLPGVLHKLFFIRPQNPHPHALRVLLTLSDKLINDYTNI